MKNIKILILGVALVFGMSSCKDWIQDVDSRDKQLEGDVYSNRSTIQAVLNGLYHKMGESALYGDDLTTGTIEILGQVYDMSAYSSTNDPSRHYTSTYTWKQIEGKRQSIWSAGFTLIRNINDFIAHIEDPSILNTITELERELMLGEAYALRAYMHFDLLRLFGPVYKLKPTELSIPYYKSVEFKRLPRISAEAAMTEVLSDIEIALGYLEVDPLLTGVYPSSSTYDGFWYRRYSNINYFATKALKARVLMYKGDTALASTTAKEVIEDPIFELVFPWATSYTADNRPLLDDAIFSFYSDKMYEKYDKMFDDSEITSPYKLLWMNRDNVIRLYPNILDAHKDSDLRSKYLYAVTMAHASEEKSGYAVRKFLKPQADNMVRYMQPLIRKAELYYIIAEADNDVTYMEAVATARKNQRSFSVPLDQDELNDEFTRETLLEGQIFFHHKRLNSSYIINGDGSEASKVGMSESKYQMPYPPKEDDIL